MKTCSTHPWEFIVNECHACESDRIVEKFREADERRQLTRAHMTSKSQDYKFVGNWGSIKRHP